MGILDTLGSLLGQVLPDIHLKVLSGNTTSDSPKTKLIKKASDKSHTKTVDKSKLTDKSHHSDSSTHTDDHSTHNTYNYTIQLPPLTPNKLPVELEPLVTAYKNRQISFIEDSSQDEVSSVLTFEIDPHVNGVLTFFKDKLESRAHILLRTGLYLKYLRDHNPDEARKQWLRITQHNTPRDRRIINLAGADYFNTYFRPLYRELKKEGEGVRRFRQQFNAIIDDMHFAIFVGADMSKSDIVNEVITKAQKNIQYGIKDEFIYIHAAGAGVFKVEDAVKELRQTFPKISTKRDKKSGKNLIKARVFYRINTFNAS